MLELPFLNSKKFIAWRTRACAKRDELLRAAQPPASFDERVWQDFKNDILVPFLGRCSYCEGRYVAGEFGDAEHYRPKAMVTEDREPIEHPGYYWLAYEWHNLLLSCKKCNSKHRDWDQKGRTSHPGKLCEFLVGSHRISAPGAVPDEWIRELQAENPLILNPYFDNPADHFEARKLGWLYHRTRRGEATIRICHLNRKELREERELGETNIPPRVTHILTQLICDTSYDPAMGYFEQRMPFSTYLNCKLSEALSERSAAIGSKVSKVATSGGR